VEQKLSQRGIAALFNVDHSTVRRSLKRHGLKTLPSIKPATPLFCSLCPNKTIEGRQVCPTCWTKIRRYRTKKLAVALLGGKCKRCGFKGHHSIFDFHHRENKDFNIGSAANKSWTVIETELKKCDLLCSNCHRLEHSDTLSPEFIGVAEKYLRKFTIAKVAQLVVAGC
jgi:hypothetical protein